MRDRYVVTMTSNGTIATYDGPQPDEIAAVAACVSLNTLPAGVYDTEVGIYGCEPVTRRVDVGANLGVDMGVTS